jgi:hypothetical protein
MKAVYVITEDSGLTKVGISQNIPVRLLDLKFTRRRPVRLAHKFEHDNARLVERVAHALLKDCHVEGEWFNVSTDAASEAISTAMGLIEKNEHHDLIRRPEPPKRERINAVQGDKKDRAVLYVKMPADVKAAAKALADADGRSLSNWLVLLIEEHVAADKKGKR